MEQPLLLAREALRIDPDNLDYSHLPDNPHRGSAHHPGLLR